MRWDGHCALRRPCRDGSRGWAVERAAAPAAENPGSSQAVAHTNTTNRVGKVSWLKTFPVSMWGFRGSEWEFHERCLVLGQRNPCRLSDVWLLPRAPPALRQLSAKTGKIAHPPAFPVPHRNSGSSRLTLLLRDFLTSVSPPPAIPDAAAPVPVPLVPCWKRAALYRG